MRWPQSSGLPRLLVGMIGVWLLLACAPSPGGARPAAPTAPVAGPPAAASAPASPAAVPSPAPVAAPAVVRVGEVRSISDSGLYIGLDHGYFQEQGIAPELIRFGSAGEQVAPLSSGQLDVGGGTAGQGIINAIARGIDIRIVADKGSHRPGFGFSVWVARKDLVDSGGLQGFADLAGKRVAVSNISTTVTMVRDLAAKGGLRPSDFEVQQIGLTDIPVGLRNGAIDVGLLLEPVPTALEEQGLGVKWASHDQIHPNYQVATLMYAGSWADAHPEVAHRFMLAYLRGVRDYNDAFVKGQNRDQIVAILTRHTPVTDPRLFDRVTPAGLNPDGFVNRESVEGDVALWHELGDVPVVPDLSRAIDDRYVRHALQQLGPYR